MSNAVNVKQGEEIDLHQLYGALANNRWLFAAVTGIFLVLSVGYALLAEPIYQSDVMIQVEQRSPMPTLATQALSQIMAQPPEDVTEIALLTSRMVVGKAVNDLKLDIKAVPQRFPLIGNFIARRFKPTGETPIAAPVFGMRRYAWGGESIQVSKFDVPDMLLGSKFRLIALGASIYELTDADGVEVLRGRVGELAHGSGVAIRVDRLEADAGTTFALTRSLTLAAIQQLQTDLVTVEQGKDSGILSLSYQSADPQLANAILQDISDAYVKQNIDRSAAEAEKSLQFVRDQLPKIKVDLDRAQAALTKFQGIAHSVDLGIETKALLDQVVVIDTNIEQIKLQAAEAAVKFQPGYRALRVIDQQIEGLNAKKAMLQKQIQSLPNTQQQLLQFMRDVEVSTQTYTALLAEAQQLDVARAGTVGNVRIVDVPAVDTTQPIKPKRLLIIAGGIVAGLVFSCLAVFIRQMLSRGIQDPAEIEELDLAVYASIPLSKKKYDSKSPGQRIAGAALVAVDNPADPAVEALRSLRTSLHFSVVESGDNRLMITGVSPNVGKTFVSCNLSMVVAQAGQRVLLIDADMRKGTTHELMGVSSENGLSDLITGRIDLAAAVRRGCGHPNLDYIPRGGLPANPAELLMHRNFSKLLADVSEQYELVIIDTPPVLAVTDASIIGNHAGTSLMVVRFGLTGVRELQLARQRLNTSGVHLQGVIFNAIEHRIAGYLSYGHYGYESDK
jgi:tyrosine-protein kinase Etk/Wzc